MIRSLITIIIVVFALPAHADQSRVPTYKFSVVPQPSYGRTTLIWKPLLQFLSRDTGYRFQLKIDRDLQSFEQHLMSGKYDFSYMSQHHYAILEEVAGYIAIARAKNRVTDGDTPQIIAAHPRVPQFVLEKVRISLIRLQESQQGRQMLSTMKEKGFQVTEDGAGDDEGPQKSALPE